MSKNEEEGKLFPSQLSTVNSELLIPNSSAMRTLDSTKKTQVESLKSEPFLTIEDVSKVYETPKGPYTVLDGVNLTINEGEFICLIGHSGCGKSTLLNMVAGFNQPTAGKLKLKGKWIEEPGPDRMVVFQNYSLLPWLSATENIHLGVGTVFADKSHSDQMQIVNEHLELVGLTEAAHKRPGQLSGGMKQRVAIARALATSPQVLILDEPFGALDPITREELQEELLKIWREHKVTVIMITHDIDEALFLADRVVMMTNGPSAHIGEDLKIPFSRPRNRARIMEDPHYYELRNFALDFLFRRFAHSEGEEEASTAPSSISSVPQVETSATQEKPENAPATKAEVKSAASATKPFATMPFNASKDTKEANMSSELNSHSSKSPESSSGKIMAFGAIWLATTIGLTMVSVGSVANLQKETAKTETTAVSASPAPIASPPPPSAMSAAPMSAPSSPASAMSAASMSAPSPASTAPASAPSSVSAIDAAPASATASANSAPATADATSAAGITDKAEIDALKQKLYTQIDSTWKTTPTFTEDLVYKVKVKQDGTILGYEATNQAAKNFVQETPLASIQNSASSASATAEKTAEFRVTFSTANGGALDVKPWE
ncbi:nitrate ABC transporter ATP-binding protein [Kamptonema animale CS-326]|jgi:nitrate/nitrite transport system ATP-binding protein|nr:nitrate ABC transporter ATP-binding protein [Kamptonema animale]MDB9513251.1 nitrate ABC transporter ATP-binding protein [Kamptonema animale CS-326]